MMLEIIQYVLPYIIAMTDIYAVARASRGLRAAIDMDRCKMRCIMQCSIPFQRLVLGSKPSLNPEDAWVQAVYAEMCRRPQLISLLKFDDDKAMKCALACWNQRANVLFKNGTPCCNFFWGMQRML